MKESYKLYLRSPGKTIVVWDFEDAEQAHQSFREARGIGTPCAITFKGKVQNSWSWDKAWLRGVIYPKEG